MLFVGIDWAEGHHDVCVLDVEGQVVARGRVSDSIEGLAQIHDLVSRGLGDGEDEPSVLIGIETDRGLMVRALVASGYELVAVNPAADAQKSQRVDITRDSQPESGMTTISAIR